MPPTSSARSLRAFLDALVAAPAGAGPSWRRWTDTQKSLLVGAAILTTACGGKSGDDSEATCQGDRCATAGAGGESNGGSPENQAGLDEGRAGEGEAGSARGGVGQGGVATGGSGTGGTGQGGFGRGGAGAGGTGSGGAGRGGAGVGGAGVGGAGDGGSGGGGGDGVAGNGAGGSGNSGGAEMGGMGMGGNVGGVAGGGWGGYYGFGGAVPYGIIMFPEECSGGDDEDVDGLVDCEDPDCIEDCPFREWNGCTPDGSSACQELVDPSYFDIRPDCPPAECGEGPYAPCGVGCTAPYTTEYPEGTEGNWAGCRGNGTAVCTDLANRLYFENHPLCSPNESCEGRYYTCNESCPLPQSDELARQDAWLGCQSGATTACVELVNVAYFEHHPDCAPNDTCSSQYTLCGEECPAPVDDELP